MTASILHAQSACAQPSDKHKRLSTLESQIHPPFHSILVLVAAAVDDMNHA